MASRTRLTPEERRSQLLDLGVRLFARRSLQEVTIDLLAETAGISRGLLYHYFGNIGGFHHAVVQRAADELIAITAPPAGGEPYDRLLASREDVMKQVRAGKMKGELLAVHDYVYDVLPAQQGRLSGDAVISSW